MITAADGEKTHASLKRLTAAEISISALDMWDKADIVRQTLAKYHKSLDETGFSNQVLSYISNQQTINLKLMWNLSVLIIHFSAFYLIVLCIHIPVSFLCTSVYFLCISVFILCTLSFLSIYVCFLSFVSYFQNFWFCEDLNVYYYLFY